MVRELLCGSTQFNEIRRGLPRMSPTLLARRLRTLEEFGVVRRTGDGRRTSYLLTAAGEELRPIVMSLGPLGRAVDRQPAAARTSSTPAS